MAHLSSRRLSVCPPTAPRRPGRSDTAMQFISVPQFGCQTKASRLAGIFYYMIFEPHRGCCDTTPKVSPPVPTLLPFHSLSLPACLLPSGVHISTSARMRNGGGQVPHHEPRLDVRSARSRSTTRSGRARRRRSAGALACATDARHFTCHAHTHTHTAGA